MKQTLDDQKSIQAKESMKTEDYFFNIHDLSRGIQRELTEGVSTRIFPGEQAMLSVVSIEPNARGTIVPRALGSMETTDNIACSPGKILVLTPSVNSR